VILVGAFAILTTKTRGKVLKGRLDPVERRRLDCMSDAPTQLYPDPRALIGVHVASLDRFEVGARWISRGLSSENNSRPTLSRPMPTAVSSTSNGSAESAPGAASWNSAWIRQASSRPVRGFGGPSREWMLAGSWSWRPC
jgi:hypothetical protein